MSEIKFCPVGGQSGVLVSENELEELAHKMDISVIDSVIPLPGMLVEQQLHRIKDCKHDEHGSQYWEVKEGGAHGWCCNHCGTATQWG